MPDGRNLKPLERRRQKGFTVSRLRALDRVRFVPAFAAGLLITGMAASGPGFAQTKVTLVAAPGKVEIEPGKKVDAWMYNGSLPGPVIRVQEGEKLTVRFINHTPEPSTVHWHGLPVPAGMDGVPGVSRPAVEPGQEFTYAFTARPSGTYFFHSHAKLQLDRGLYGVLIIEPKKGVDPPFDRDYLVVLDDWLAGPPVPSRDPQYADYLINGKTARGQTPFQVRKGEKVRLRFVNASAGTNYVVAVDGHPMTVTHTDGRPVKPVQAQAIPIGAGERYDVIVDATNPGVWSIAAADYMQRGVTLVRAVLAYEGSNQPIPSPAYVPPSLKSATLLTYSQLASAGPVPPIKSVPDRRHDLTLGLMHGYVWTINGQAWPAAAPLPIRSGESVRMSMRNMTMHEHPMHIHGHFYRLLNTAGGTAAPPMKDTVLVPRGMMSRIEVEVLADNPGNWAFHCHHIYHAESGMFRLLEYENGDADQDGLTDGRDLDPLSPYPVLATSPQGQGFRTGTTMGLEAQWKGGETVLFFLGPLLEPAIGLGDLGMLHLMPFVSVGAGRTQGDNVARISIPIPAVPGLKGQRIGFQAAATHPSLSPGIRLSTCAIVTVQ